MGAPNGLPEKTIAAIRAKARQRAAEAPLPGPEQTRLIAPHFYPAPATKRRRRPAA